MTLAGDFFLYRQPIYCELDRVGGRKTPLHFYQRLSPQQYAPPFIFPWTFSTTPPTLWEILRTTVGPQIVQFH